MRYNLCRQRLPVARAAQRDMMRRVGGGVDVGSERERTLRRGE